MHTLLQANNSVSGMLEKHKWKMGIANRTRTTFYLATNGYKGSENRE